MDDSTLEPLELTKGRRVVYVPDHATGAAHRDAQPGVVADQENAESFRPDTGELLVLYDNAERRMETGDEPFTAQRTPVRNLYPVADLHESTGDVACPHCKTIHVTPPGAHIGPGLLRCQLCGEPSAVTEHVAGRANAVAEADADE